MRRGLVHHIESIGGIEGPASARTMTNCFRCFQGLPVGLIQITPADAATTLFAAAVGFHQQTGSLKCRLAAAKRFDTGVGFRPVSCHFRLYGKLQRNTGITFFLEVIV